MGGFFFIIGALLKEFPPPATSSVANPDPPPASKAMAAMLYLYVCFYSMGAQRPKRFLSIESNCNADYEWWRV
jgi:hypothetical protein